MQSSGSKSQGPHTLQMDFIIVVQHWAPGGGAWGPGMDRPVTTSKSPLHKLGWERTLSSANGRASKQAIFY